MTRPAALPAGILSAPAVDPSGRRIAFVPLDGAGRAIPVRERR